MRVCLIGKYPPIQGGVSTETYWTVHALARRGHEVHVVTNSTEVEHGYRELLLEDDLSWLEGRYDSGVVACHASASLARGSYLPWQSLTAPNSLALPSR